MNGTNKRRVSTSSIAARKDIIRKNSVVPGCGTTSPDGKGKP